MSTENPARTGQTDSPLYRSRPTLIEDDGEVVNKQSARRKITHARPLGGRIPQHPNELKQSFNRPGPGDELEYRDSQYRLAERLHVRSKWLRRRGKEKSQRKGLEEIGRLASCLNLPRHTHEEAARIFHSARKAEGIGDGEDFEGHDIDAVAAAAVYIAASISGSPRSMSEVVDEAYCHTVSFRREKSQLNTHLAIPPFEPTPIIKRHSNPLTENLTWDDDRLPDVVLEATAERLLKTGEDVDDFQNRSVRAQAAGALYLAAQRMDLRLTQQCISDALEIGVKALRAAYQDLEEAVDDDSDA